MTNRKQGKRQAEVLRSLGIPFLLVDGKPKVLLMHSDLKTTRGHYRTGPKVKPLK